MTDNGYGAQAQQNAAKREQDRKDRQLKWPICKDVKCKLVKLYAGLNRAGTAFQVIAEFTPTEWPAEHNEVMNKIVYEKNRSVKQYYGFNPTYDNGDENKKVFRGMNQDLITDLAMAGADLSILPATPEGQLYVDVDPGYAILNRLLQTIVNGPNAIFVIFNIAQGSVKNLQTGGWDKTDEKRKFWPGDWPKVIAAPAQVQQPVVQQEAPVQQPATPIQEVPAQQAFQQPTQPAGGPPPPPAGNMGAFGG